MKKKISLEKLIYAAVFFLPIYLWRLKFFGVSINVWEILVFLILVFWLARTKKKDVRENFLIFRKYLYPIALIFFGFLFSTLAGGRYFSGLGIIKGWLVFPLVFSWLAVSCVPAEKRKNIYLAYYFSAVFVSLFSLVLYFSGHVTFDHRLQGIFNSPNYLAMYLAPAMIIALVKIGKITNYKLQITNNFKITNTKYQAIFSIPLLLIIVTFYLTYSYAAWGAVTIAIGVVFLVQKNISSNQIALAAAIMILLVATQIKNTKFVDLIGANSRSSLASRVMIWHVAGKMLENRWLFGVGPGNFQEKYLEYQKYYPPYLEWAVPHPHNVFLSFWLSGGILGLVGFLWLLLVFFGDVWGKIRRVETRQCLVSTEVIYISLGIISYFLLHGLVDTTYFKNDLAVVFWLACFLVGERPGFFKRNKLEYSIFFSKFSLNQRQPKPACRQGKF